MTAFRVGITGGLASGKSTVARAFAEAGFTVVDADQLVRELYRAGEPGAAAVEHLFGRAVLDESGAVDSAKLAPLVFQSVAKRRSLEQAIHPLVRERFARAAGAVDGVAVLEATLLVEAGYAPDFDLLISVEANLDVRRRRAIARGMSPADADARLTVQGRGRARRLAAHRMIRNDGDRAELDRSITALVDEIRTRVEGRPFALEPFVLVTGNPGKIAEARRLAGRALVAERLDLPEIQSLELEEVLAAKADAAFARLGRAVVVEETGLYLAGLNGFPGPLVRWMLESIGPEGVAKQALASGDAAAAARCALYYRSATCSVLAAGETLGQLVLPPRGNNGFGWDPVFEDRATTRTYGEMTDEEKDEAGHRGRAWRGLLDKLRAAQPSHSSA